MPRGSEDPARDSFSWLAGNAVVYVSGSVLRNLISFFLLPLYTRFLTPDDYGVLAICEVTAAVAAMITGLTLFNAVLRFHAMYADNRKTLGEWYSTIYYTMSVATLLGCGLVAFFTDPVSRVLFGKLQYQAQFAWALRVVMLTTLFNNGVSFFTYLLQAQERPWVYTAFNIGQFLLNTLLAIYFVVFRGMGYWGTLLAGMIAAGAAYLASFACQRGMLWKPFRKALLAPSFAFCYPYLIMQVLNWAGNASDRFLINWFHTLADTGLFSIALKVSFILNFLVTGFHQAWVPFFFRMLEEKGRAAHAIIARYTTYFVAAVVFAALGVAIYSRELFTVMVGVKFLPAWKLVPVLAISIVANLGGSLCWNQIAFAKKTIWITGLTFLASLVLLASNLLLIPRFGGLGAACGAVISAVFSSAIFIPAAQKAYRLPLEFGRAGIIIAAAVVVGAAGIFLSPERFWLAIPVKLAWLALFGVILAAMGAITREEFCALRDWLRSLAARAGSAGYFSRRKPS